MQNTQSAAAIRVRPAAEADAGLLLQMIRELAEYEHLEEHVAATEEILLENVFRRRGAEVVFCEADGEPAGYALYFSNFSTFTGRPGIYLEDLYVRPGVRGKGCGKALLAFVAGLAAERGCARVDWACLNWNTPSQQFYLKMGAVPQDDWTGFRLDAAGLKNLAGK